MYTVATKFLCIRLCRFGIEHWNFVVNLKLLFQQFRVNQLGVYPKACVRRMSQQIVKRHCVSTHTHTQTEKGGLICLQNIIPYILQPICYSPPLFCSKTKDLYSLIFIQRPDQAPGFVKGLNASYTFNTPTPTLINSHHSVSSYQYCMLLSGQQN